MSAALSLIPLFNAAIQVRARAPNKHRRTKSDPTTSFIAIFTHIHTYPHALQGTLIPTPGEPDRWSSTPVTPRLFPYPTTEHFSFRKEKFESVSGSYGPSCYLIFTNATVTMGTCRALCFPLRNQRFKTCTNARIVLCCCRERAVTHQRLGPRLPSG